MRMLTLFGVVALLAMSCSKKQDSFGKPGQAVKVEWMTDSTFQPVNQRYGEGGQGEVMLSGGQYALSLDGFPAGSGWQIGDRKGQLESSERNGIDVADVSDQLGKLVYGDPDLGQAEVKVDATLVLDIKGGGRMEVELPPIKVGSAVSDLMRGALEGPITFAGEPADDGPPGNVLLTYGRRRRMEADRAGQAGAGHRHGRGDAMAARGQGQDRMHRLPGRRCGHGEQELPAGIPRYRDRDS